MSARKDYPITITNSQWEAMRQSVTNAESRATNAERNARDAEADAQRKIRDLQERSSQEIAGLNQVLQNQARNHAEALNHIENDFNNKLQQQGLTFQEALRSQRDEFDRKLRDSHIDLQAQINDVTQRMEAERQSKLQIATYWVNQAQNLLNGISSRYRHHLFAPPHISWGKLNSILISAQDDLKNENEQAALSTARSVCFDAMELQEYLIAGEWEWTQLFNHANSSLVGVKNRIEGLNSLEYVEQEDGKQISIPAKVDFWARGALSEAIRKQQRLENIISNDIENLSLDEIRSVIRGIESLDIELSEIDSLARDNYCASQIRRETGAGLIDRLHGWNLEEILFASEDERENLHLIFRHIGGTDRLSLIVRGGNLDHTNVTADYFCYGHNDGERHDEYVSQVTQAISDTVDCEVQPRTELRFQGRTSGDITTLDVKEIRRRKQQ